MLSKFNQTKPAVKIKGGDGKCFVTYLGAVKDEFGNDLPYSLNSNNEKIVHVQFLDVVGTYRVVDLICLHFKDFEHFDKNLLNDIIAFNIDGDVNNLHASNIGYHFKDGKLEVPGYDGFYYVPGFPRRAINRDGLIISTKKLEPLKWYITKPQTSKKSTGGYYTNRVEIDGKGMTLLRHRAMLLVFKGYPNDVDKLTCNHINGVPGDDYLDNLEWVNYSGNLLHSYKQNLKTQNKPVCARNVFTGEEKTYYSVAECGRDLCISDRTINYKLEKSKFSSVTRFGHQFKYLEDPRDWVIPDDPQTAVDNALQAITVSITTPDGVEKISKSIGLTSIMTGISRFRISKGIKTGEVVDGFLFKAID